MKEFTLQQNIYYYCNIDVFESIISKKTIWLTDVTRSNDRDEIFSTFNSYVNELENAIKNEEKLEDDCKTKLVKNIEKNRNRIFEDDYWLVMCFSSLRDALQIAIASGQQGRNSRSVKDIIPGQMLS